jgi:predicted NAD/FAD-dependent oxidoreductase
MNRKIAVIGAGLAGLALARQLQGFANVTVFEKSRGLGGRMAERRRGDYRFDHGAQYFTTRDPEFRELVDAMTSTGGVVLWDVEIDDRRPGALKTNETRHIGAPGMNGLARAIGRDLDIKLETERDRQCGRIARPVRLDDLDRARTANSAAHAERMRLCRCAFQGPHERLFYPDDRPRTRT